MLELLLLAALLQGLIRAARARHRWALGTGGAALYLLLADTLAVVAASAQPQPVYAVFNLFLLGPGSSAVREPGLLPVPGLLLQHPLALRGLRIALCAAGSWRCLDQSSRLNPLLPRAYQLDDIALPLAGAAVLDTLEAVVLIFALQLAART